MGHFVDFRWVVALGALLACTPTFADDISLNPSAPVVLSESNALMQRIADLERQVSSLNHKQNCHLPDLLHHQQNCRDCGSGYLYGGVEVSFLRPYLSGARSSATATGGKWIDPSYGAAPRFFIGKHGDGGLGLRARYFSFNHGADLAVGFGGGGFGVKAMALDTEVTLQEKFRNWDLDLAGGLRWGQMSINGDNTVVFPGRLTFKGIGPTVAIEARRPIGNSGFALFGNFRGSLLLGEIHNTHPARGLAAGGVEDEITTIFENQLGVNWQRKVSENAVLEFRAAWETQFWLNDTIADDVYGIGTNLALSGPTLAVELRY